MFTSNAFMVVKAAKANMVRNSSNAVLGKASSRILQRLRSFLGLDTSVLTFGSGCDQGGGVGSRGSVGPRRGVLEY